MTPELWTAFWCGLIGSAIGYAVCALTYRRSEYRTIKAEHDRQKSRVESMLVNGGWNPEPTYDPPPAPPEPPKARLHTAEDEDCWREMLRKHGLCPGKPAKPKTMLLREGQDPPRPRNA